MNAAPNNLAVLRQQRGLSQRRLGDLLEAHWMTISKLERGKMQLTELWLKKLSLVLGCRVSDILNDDTPATPGALTLPSAIIAALRRNVFRENQVEFAQTAGVTQPTISKWERGEGAPTLENIIAIRAAAEMRGIVFDAEWFFAPAPSPLMLDTEAGDEARFAATARRYLGDVISSAGLSASAIAKRAGINPTTLTRFLNDPDHRFVLSMRTIMKIQEATSIPFVSGGELLEQDPVAPVSLPDNALDRAVEIAGGLQALARAIGVSAQAVSQWRRVPPLRVIAVEAATGVPRSALRPDLYPPEEAVA